MFSNVFGVSMGPRDPWDQCNKLMKNSFFRKELNNALSFDFNDVKWIFLDISAAYTAGLFSARLKEFKIDRKDIVNETTLMEDNYLND